MTPVVTDIMDLELGFLLSPDVDPAALPASLTAGVEYVPRHRAVRPRCPWLDVVVPTATGALAVQDAAVASMLDQPVAFIKSPTAKHAHDGTALAMLDHAAYVLRATLAGRSVSRRVLRGLLKKLEAML